MPNIEDTNREVPMTGGDSVSINRDALSEMLRDVVELSKKPWKDPEVEARKQRNRERLRTERERAVAETKRRQAVCAHRRSDNTSAIAWAMQSDAVTRGVCMRCDRLIVPGDEDYVDLGRIPTRAPGVIY